MPQNSRNKVPNENDIDFWLKVSIQEKEQVKRLGAWYFPMKYKWGVPKYLNNSQKTALNKWIDLSKPELPREIKNLARTLAEYYFEDVVKLLPFKLEMNFKSDIPKFPLDIYNIDPRLAGSFCEYIVNRVICERTNIDYRWKNHISIYDDLCSNYCLIANYYRKQNDWSEAFKYYKLSYNINPIKSKGLYDPACQWIRHCLLNGLGVEKNIELSNKYIQIVDNYGEEEEEEEDNIDIENIKSSILEGEQHLKEMENAYIECNDITNKTIDILPSILLNSLNHHYTHRQDTSRKDIIRKSLSDGQLNNFVKELNDMLPVEGLNKDDIKCNYDSALGGQDIIIKDTVIDYKLSNTEYRYEDILQLLLYASKRNCDQGRLIKKCEIWNFLEGKIYAIDLSSWYLYAQREFLMFCKIL